MLLHLRLEQLINKIDNDNKQQTISYAVNTKFVLLFFFNIYNYSYSTDTYLCLIFIYWKGKKMSEYIH